MENIIELIQFSQVIFMFYLFYVLIDIKSKKIEILSFSLIL